MGSVATFYTIGIGNIRLRRIYFFPTVFRIIFFLVLINLFIFFDASQCISTFSESVEYQTGSVVLKDKIEYIASAFVPKNSYYPGLYIDYEELPYFRPQVCLSSRTYVSGEVCKFENHCFAASKLISGAVIHGGSENSENENNGNDSDTSYWEDLGVVGTEYCEPPLPIKVFALDDLLVESEIVLDSNRYFRVIRKIQGVSPIYPQNPWIPRNSESSLYVPYRSYKAEDMVLYQGKWYTARGNVDSYGQKPAGIPNFLPEELLRKAAPCKDMTKEVYTKGSICFCEPVYLMASYDTKIKPELSSGNYLLDNGKPWRVLDITLPSLLILDCTGREYYDIGMWCKYNEKNYVAIQFTHQFIPFEKSDLWVEHSGREALEINLKGFYSKDDIVLSDGRFFIATSAHSPNGEHPSISPFTTTNLHFPNCTDTLTWRIGDICQIDNSFRELSVDSQVANPEWVEVADISSIINAEEQGIQEFSIDKLYFPCDVFILNKIKYRVLRRAMGVSPKNPHKGWVSVDINMNSKLFNRYRQYDKHSCVEYEGMFFCATRNIEPFSSIPDETNLFLNLSTRISECTHGKFFTKHELCSYNAITYQALWPTTTTPAETVNTNAKPKHFGPWKSVTYFFPLTFSQKIFAIPYTSYGHVYFPNQIISLNGSFFFPTQLIVSHKDSLNQGDWIRVSPVDVFFDNIQYPKHSEVIFNKKKYISTGNVLPWSYSPSNESAFVEVTESNFGKSDKRFLLFVKYGIEAIYERSYANFEFSDIKNAALDFSLDVTYVRGQLVHYKEKFFLVTRRSHTVAPLDKQNLWVLKTLPQNNFYFRKQDYVLIVTLLSISLTIVGLCLFKLCYGKKVVYPFENSTSFHEKMGSFNQSKHCLNVSQVGNEEEELPILVFDDEDF